MIKLQIVVSKATLMGGGNESLSKVFCNGCSVHHDSLLQRMWQQDSGPCCARRQDAIIKPTMFTSGSLQTLRAARDGCHARWERVSWAVFWGQCTQRQRGMTALKGSKQKLYHPLLTLGAHARGFSCLVCVCVCVCVCLSVNALAAHSTLYAARGWCGCCGHQKEMVHATHKTKEEIYECPSAASSSKQAVYDIHPAACCNGYDSLVGQLRIPQAGYIYRITEPSLSLEAIREFWADNCQV